MLKIGAMILAMILFIFLGSLFLELSIDTDNTILSSVFSTLAIVFLLFGAVSVLAFLGFIIEIGGADNG
jgi:hypothetical protein